MEYPRKYVERWLNEVLRDYSFLMETCCDQTVEKMEMDGFQVLNCRDCARDFDGNGERREHGDMRALPAIEQFKHCFSFV